MKTKLIISFLLFLLLTAVGYIVYTSYEQKKRDESISALISDQGQNKIIEKYVKDSVTHTIFKDRLIPDSEAAKKAALGSTYTDSLQKALKRSIDKIDQVTKINAQLVAQVALTNKQAPSGQMIKTHKDEFLDLSYDPETDSVKMAYNIKLNDARYSERKWLFGKKQNYIHLFSDDKRVTINGLKGFTVKESSPKRFGIGPSAGFAASLDGNVIKFRPYIGFSINYNAIEF